MTRRTLRSFPVTQALLNSALNLTHFTYLHGAKYPDLSKHTALKWIEMGWYRKVVPNCRHVHGLNQMLHGVRDHVEFLHFESDITGINPENPEGAVPPFKIGFNLPQMTKLKEFRNDMLNWFQCGVKLRDISTERIPTLQSLQLFNTETELDGVLIRIVKKKDLFSGVKNLSVANVEDPKLISALKSPFPKLERLSIMQIGNRGAEKLVEVGQHLAACAPLGLKHLELELSNELTNLSEFSEEVGNCGEFLKGNGTTKLFI